MDYSILDGQYYVLTDIDTGEKIAVGEIVEGNILSTIHPVEFVDKETYDQFEI